MRTRKGLSRRAQSLWREVVKSNPHLTEADSITLGLYCELMTQLNTAIAEAAKVGATSVSENGNPYLNANGQLVAMLTDKTTRLARELRITAATRPRDFAPSKVATKPRIAKFKAS